MTVIYSNYINTVYMLNVDFLYFVLFIWFKSFELFVFALFIYLFSISIVIFVICFSFSEFHSAVSGR